MNYLDPRTEAAVDALKKILHTQICDCDQSEHKCIDVAEVAEKALILASQPLDEFAGMTRREWEEESFRNSLRSDTPKPSIAYETIANAIKEINYEHKI